MLRAGGNAADAAAAAAFALAVVEPYSTGLGGGGFALARMNATLVFLDFRESAPAAATRDMYMRNGTVDETLARDGALAAAVPGAVAGYLALHERFGKLPRARVLAPAIRYAEGGFVATPRYRDFATKRLDVLRRDGEAARIFLVPGESAPAVPPLGHRVVQRDLAATLRAIAKDGANGFYRGAIGAKLVADMQARGGLITERDLHAVRVRERQPLVGSYQGHAIATAPPPSAGGQALLTLLNIVETQAQPAWRHPDGLHLYIEAAKRAFADRALVGDPAFVKDLTSRLITKERARVLAQVIGPSATPAADIPPGQAAELPFVAPPQVHWLPREAPHTTHLSVVDAEGNAVSLTTTINYRFGACVVARGTGVLWNDEMDDFAAAPGAPNVYGIVGHTANQVVAGKIPVSSMAPTLVFAGSSVDTPVRIVLGSPGGSRIPTTVAQIIINHLTYGADIATALAMGRVHHQHLPDVVYVEPFALDALTRAALSARGHELREDPPWSDATAIAVDPKTGVRTGSADPRGEGVASAE